MEIKLAQVPKRFLMIGHVDSGKSTILGHLLFDLSNFDEHEKNKILNSNPKKRQIYSDILDTFEEERERGKTSVYSVHHFDYDNSSFECIDNPGHLIYIKEMIAGLSLFPVDEMIACLVISMGGDEAMSGIEGGTTKEDLYIARAMGITNLIIVYNKMDLIDWDLKFVSKIKLLIDPFIKSCKFKNVKQVYVSGYQGIGLHSKSLSPIENSPTFLDTIIEMNESIILKKQQDSKSIEKDHFVESKFTKVQGKMFVLDTKNLIAIGFIGMAHFQGQESEFILKNCANQDPKKLKFMVQGDKAKVLIELTDPFKKIYESNTILLRNANHTIGYIVIEQTK